jgi:dCTP deaminase
MAFWSDKKWKTVAKKNNLVTPFDVTRVEAANYLLSIGDEIYVSEPDKGSVVKKLKIGENFYIEPGQFAFLLTEETIQVPTNVLGFISIRARIKFLGLVNISGFHVDPGYSGKLVFSVFNAGPTRIQLKQGDDIFPIWFADLDIDSSNGIQQGYSDIPSKILTPISGNFTTAYQVSKEVSKLAVDQGNLQTRLAKAESNITTIKTKYLIYGGFVLFVWSIVLLIFGPALRDQVFILLKSPLNIVNPVRLDENLLETDTKSPVQKTPKHGVIELKLYS